MGVISSKRNDIYNSKWVTAEVVDSSNRVRYIPIKVTIGDYWLCVLDKQIYCFKIQPERIITYRESLVRSFKILWFETSNYKPISPANIKALEEMIQINNLPKLDQHLYKVLKILAEREKSGEEFNQHSLETVLEELDKKESKYPEQVKNLRTFIDRLDRKQIITPIKKTVEFIDGEIKTTDPQFLGNILGAVLRTVFELKKVTNTPVTGKFPMLKVLVIMVIILGLGVGVYLLWNSGALQGVQLPGTTQAPTQTSLMQKYPTPESIIDGINKGEIKLTDLPKPMQDMVKNYKPPQTVQPKS